MKIKECEKRDKYLDLIKELRKLWNMRVTVVPIAHRTVLKGLKRGHEVLEIGGRIETILATALFRSANIVRIVVENSRDLQSLRFQ